MPMVPLIEVADLHKTLRAHGAHARTCSGASTSRIEQGEVVAIVGPSGAGKSTLLHCIGTLDLPAERHASASAATS